MMIIFTIKFNKMFLQLLILSAIILAIAVAGFGIRMLLQTNGKFPETHVSRSPEMRKRGITCAQQTDIGCNSTEGYPGCSSCNGKGF
jgi:hypothetical protein